MVEGQVSALAMKICLRPPKFDFFGGTRCLLELKVGSMYVRQHSTVYVVIISQTRTHPCSSAQIHH